MLSYACTVTVGDVDNLWDSVQRELPHPSRATAQAPLTEPPPQAVNLLSFILEHQSLTTTSAKAQHLS